MTLVDQSDNPIQKTMFNEQLFKEAEEITHGWFWCSGRPDVRAKVEEFANVWELPTVTHYAAFIAHYCMLCDRQADEKKSRKASITLGGTHPPLGYIDQFGSPMRTVRDLIADLQELNPDLPVAVYHDDGEPTANDAVFLGTTRGFDPENGRCIYFEAAIIDSV